MPHGSGRSSQLRDFTMLNPAEDGNLAMLAAAEVRDFLVLSPALIRNLLMLALDARALDGPNPGKDVGLRDVAHR